MTDLVPTIPRLAPTVSLVIPDTGVVVTKESPDEDVAELLAYLREGRKRLDELDGEVSSWLRDRADARGKWTLAGGRVSMPSNRPETTWNKVKLAETLAALHDEGLITGEDLEECAPLVVELRLAAITKLRDRSMPAIVERIDAAKVSVPKGSRPVKVKP